MDIVFLVFVILLLYAYGRSIKKDITFAESVADIFVFVKDFVDEVKKNI